LAANPVPLTSPSAAVTASLPALALASVPLAALLKVSISLLTRPDNTAVPVNASTVLPL